MNLKHHFTALLNDQTIDLESSQHTWDRRAEEVSHFTVQPKDVALQKVLQRHSLADASVLEISFGGGRHLLEFAQQGAQVSGVEISAKMLKHTEEKLQHAGLQGQVGQLVHSSCEELQLAEYDWQAAFELVFLYMSPAISSTAMLQKALAASYAGVSMALYAYREDSLLSQLQDELNLPRRPMGSKSADDIYNIFNWLYQWGYFPELEFEERSQTNSYAPDYILQRYASWLWRDEVNADKTQRLLDVLQAKANDGQVSTTSRDIVGHLYVDKRVRR